jgi:hypothetical protein
MPPIPIAMPVRVMTRHDMVAKVANALIRLLCDYRTRRLCARITRRRLYTRWVPKCRKSRSCALKVRSTTSGARSTKAYATSTGASSCYDLSATTEPTAAETAASEVSASKASTATAEVTSATSTVAATSTAKSSPTTAAAAASHCLTHCGKQNYTN